MKLKYFDMKILCCKKIYANLRYVQFLMHILSRPMPSIILFYTIRTDIIQAYLYYNSFAFKEAQERAPSAVMSALVEKLRSDLAEKEKKHRAMGRALADLKRY